MVKELCYRCNKPVYPTDKVGPLKASTFFHQGCFKCYICGTRLALKTYCNNRNNIDDKEVYCNNHVPNPNPHDIPIISKANAYINNRDIVNNNNIPNFYKDNKTNNHYNIEYKRPDAGLHDLKIAHAMKATQVAKPYPKIKHEGAKYIVDYDAQTRLELIHRKNEDILYQKFDENRQKELKIFEEETKEEWEKALSEFTRKYEQGEANNYQKDDLIRQLTIKRNKKLETINFKRKERERHQTAELVDQQAKEMLELFRQARIKEKNHCVFHDNENNSLNLNNSYDKNNYQESYYVDNMESFNVASASYPATPPPPLPPSYSKRHLYTDPSVFNNIDEVAANLAQSEVNTFTQLIRILISGARSDVDKARAIFKWITVKNLNTMIFDNNLDKDTPMGLLRGIKYGTESYHVLFKRLCSYAGLHCVVIKGYSKSAGYQPGVCFDESARFRNTWNAVFLDGSWRFVQCNWGARHLVNSKDNKNDTFLLKDKKIHNFYSTFESSKDGSLRYEYDDHYFMTDPEEFIYEFFPQQSEWQLLPRPITLHQFEQLPFVRSLFFRFGLSFVDPKISSVLSTDETGAATISIASTNKPGVENIIKNENEYNLVSNNSSTSVNNLIFHYNLRFYDSDENTINGFNLKRFVMQSTINNVNPNNGKKDSIFVFRVHAPSIRPLLLDIFCNSVSVDYYLTGQPIKFKSICKFKIVCERLNVIMIPLPECASGEWGPAKAFRLFGLVPITHLDAIINCEQYCEIVFKMLKPLSEFIVTLHNNRYESRNLHKCCKTYIEENKVCIVLKFLEEGQYGLDIYTRDENQLNINGKQLLTHCCKYLVNVKIN